jgi:hypothetical protein
MEGRHYLMGITLARQKRIFFHSYQMSYVLPLTSIKQQFCKLSWNESLKRAMEMEYIKGRKSLILNCPQSKIDVKNRYKAY